jgi:cytochrome c-type biogenesis protein CcmH
MGDRLRRWGVPATMLLLVAVITVGLVTAPPSHGDRADALAHQLRCPVCQGESVADSPSDTATAIRTQIAEMVAGGSSDADILDHYVERYGRWVLLDPPARGDTLLLWLLPVAALLAGLAAIVTRRRRDPPARSLTDEERAALRRHVSAVRHPEDDA